MSMSSSIEDVTESLIGIKDQFLENDEILQAVLEHEDSEELLIVLGMADALSAGVITLNKTGEKRLKSTLKELEQLLEDFEDGDE
jgi:molybdopterin-guanine dinucleotide biosynthesis protein A